MVSGVCGMWYVGCSSKFDIFGLLFVVCGLRVVACDLLLDI